MDAFYKNIRYHRIRCDMSQTDLAIKLNSRQTTVSTWERGLATPPLATIKQMAEIFDISLNDLLYNPNHVDNDISFDDHLIAAFHAADASTKEQVCNLLGLSISLP